MNALKKIINFNDIVRFIIFFFIIFVILTFFLKPNVKYQNTIKLENKIDQTFMSTIKLNNLNCFIDVDYDNVIQNLRNEKSFIYLSNLSNNISLEIENDSNNNSSIYIIEFEQDIKKENIIETLEKVNVEVSLIVNNLIKERLNYCLAKQNELSQQKTLDFINVFINYFRAFGIKTQNIESEDFTLLFDEMMNDFNLDANDKSYFNNDLIKKIINKKNVKLLYFEILDERNKLNINRFVFIILTSLVIGLLFSGIYQLIKVNYKRVN